MCRLGFGFNISVHSFLEDLILQGGAYKDPVLCEVFQKPLWRHSFLLSCWKWKNHTKLVEFSPCPNLIRHLGIQKELFAFPWSTAEFQKDWFGMEFAVALLLCLFTSSGNKCLDNGPVVFHGGAWVSACSSMLYRNKITYGIRCMYSGGG